MRSRDLGSSGDSSTSQLHRLAATRTEQGAGGRVRGEDRGGLQYEYEPLSTSIHWPRTDRFTISTGHNDHNENSHTHTYARTHARNFDHSVSPTGDLLNNVIACVTFFLIIIIKKELIINYIITKIFYVKHSRLIMA